MSAALRIMGNARPPAHRRRRTDRTLQRSTLLLTTGVEYVHLPTLPPSSKYANVGSGAPRWFAPESKTFLCPTTFALPPVCQKLLISEMRLTESSTSSAV